MLDILNNITDPGPWHPDGVQHVYIYGRVYNITSTGPLRRYYLEL